MVGWGGIVFFLLLSAVVRWDWMLGGVIVQAPACVAGKCAPGLLVVGLVLGGESIQERKS